MTTQAVLTVQFGLPTGADNTDFVLLEQEPWDPYVGYLTKAGAFAYLNELIFAGDPAPDENCEGLNDAYTSKVYAYPSRPALQYRFILSHGNFFGPAIETKEFVEDVQCDLKKELSLKYPALSITKYEWAGLTYDKEGTVIPTPVITLANNTLTLAGEVYGTLIVSYMVEQHIYDVDIQARAGAIEEKYQSFALAVWDGGNTGMELKTPSGAEEDICNTSRGTSIKITDIPGEPYVDSKNDNYEVSYCTGVVKGKVLEI